MRILSVIRCVVGSLFRDGHAYGWPVAGETPGTATMTCARCCTVKPVLLSERPLELPAIRPLRASVVKTPTAADRARARLVHEAEPRSRVSRFPQRGER